MPLFAITADNNTTTMNTAVVTNSLTAGEIRSDYIHIGRAADADSYINHSGTIKLASQNIRVNGTTTEITGVLTTIIGENLILANKNTEATATIKILPKDSSANSSCKIELTGDTVTTNNLTIGNTATNSTLLTVNGMSQFNKPVTIGEEENETNILTINGNTEVKGNLTVTGGLNAATLKFTTNGNSNKFTYIDTDGKLKIRSTKLGSENKPIYIKDTGEFAECQYYRGYTMTNILLHAGEKNKGNSTAQSTT